MLFFYCGPNKCTVNPLRLEAKMGISEDETVSRPRDLTQYDRQRFCHGYPARIHNHEKEAGDGSREARAN